MTRQFIRYRHNPKGFYGTFPIFDALRSTLPVVDKKIKFINIIIKL